DVFSVRRSAITTIAINTPGINLFSYLTPFRLRKPIIITQNQFCKRSILKFDCYGNLKTWLESDIRREWIERLQPLIEKPEDIQTLTGLETWFTLSDKPMMSPPPRYKMVLVSWLGVFFTLPQLNRLLVPLLSGLPVLLNQLISTGLGVALLTYVIMPRLTQLFRKWLYPISYPSSITFGSKQVVNKSNHPEA
ncbi:hypothetical protein, partial [Nostoc sp. FACHB-888]|uniref:hypothetical protein n=1 Tax=Nostoc sp. FACHB-888 TaxID=2692842 RepID=UPI002411362D